MVIKCKMCGGDIDLSEERTYGTCDSCGSTVTLPRIGDEQRAAAFNRGEHFRRMGEFDKALAVYERILQEDDTDAEAHWCCALCRFGIEYVKDSAAREWLPICHRASFDSFLEDVDYLAAVEHSDGVTRRQYQKEAAKIAEVQRDILATSQNEKPFDVFICHKESDENGQRTQDSLLAQEIYYQLTGQGLRVFWARITLADKADAQYEPCIFAALNSAKVMVAVSTKPEHMNAVWVKNEWRRFLALMQKDRSRLLIPCCLDMEPDDLPEQLSVLQTYDMGKPGFIQHLIRSVMKVLGRDQKPAPAAETVVAQQTEGNANMIALLKRGSMALENGSWDDANDDFDQVLDVDAECAQAYMGKFLAARQCQSLELFLQKYLEQFASVKSTKEIAVDADTGRMNAVLARAFPSECAWRDLGDAFDAAELKKQMQELFTSIDRTYLSRLKASEELARQGKAMFDSDRQLSQAMRFAKGTYRDELQQAFVQFTANLDAQVEKARQADASRIARTREVYAEKLDIAERQAMAKWENAMESVYEEACQNLASSDREKVALAVSRFNVLAACDYKDSAEKARICHEKAEKMARAKRRNKILICAICVVLVVTAVWAWLYFNQFAARNHYKTGEALLEQQNYAAAIEAFQAAGNYQDAPQRVEAILAIEHYEKAETLLAAGDYDGAIQEFRDAQQYRNAQQRVLQTYYAKGEALLTQEDYDGAAKAFESAGDYEDAAARAQAAHEQQSLQEDYALGEALLGQGDYDGAVTAFEAAGNYKDAAARIPATHYAHAEALLAQKDYDGAIAAFEAAGDYQDAAAHVLNLAHYVAAENLLAEGRLSAAAIAFSKMGDYQDAPIRSAALWDEITKRKATLAGGSQHTVGLKSDGTVIAVGSNNSGECNVNDWTDIMMISAGSSFTVGLKSNGTVVAVGSNHYGQCGVSGWTDIVAVSAGANHTVGLKSDGTVVAVGSNRYGECNVSDWTDIVAVSAGGSHTLGLRSDGTVVAVGSNRYGECNVSGWTDIVAVSTGSEHTVGLRSDGTVVAVGAVGFGQCNVSDWTDIVAVSVGDSHTVGLKSDGTVVAAGWNLYGRCDVGGWSDIVAVSAGSDHTLGLQSDGTVVAVGDSPNGECNVSGWTNIKLP